MILVKCDACGKEIDPEAPGTANDAVRVGVSIANCPFQADACGPACVSGALDAAKKRALSRMRAFAPVENQQKEAAS
jgi:hypothetical protein